MSASVTVTLSPDRCLVKIGDGHEVGRKMAHPPSHGPSIITVAGTCPGHPNLAQTKGRIAVRCGLLAHSPKFTQPAPDFESPELL
jgi:hypothetical protein